MGKKNYKTQEIILRNNLEVIPNIYDLKKVGAGHDGIVFQYKDMALKLLKYDINTRKQKGLMTFEKALFLQKEILLKRILQPIDIMLDSDGVYAGFVTRYLDDVTRKEKIGTSRYKTPGQFTCGDLICSSNELEEDFNELTKNNVLAKDINRGSYIYTNDFIYLCDMDKYIIGDISSIENLNRINLNFIIAKFLYYEMLKQENIDKIQQRQLSKWVSRKSNSVTYLNELQNDIRYDYNTPISDYAKEKVKTLIRQ